MKQNRLLRCLAIALASVLPFAAQADYPDKPLRLVVPFPPGGSTEPLARVLSQKLGESFGQQVIVDNRPGAGSTIGAEIVARSPADGYTLLLSSISNAISAALYPKLNFDIVRDFAPITLLATTPGVLVVHPALPVKTVKEFIALAKAKPEQLAYSSAGNGTPPHLSAELFAGMTGIKLIHVPYKGGGPSIIALLSGEAQLSIASLPSAIGHMRSGKLRALGVTTPQRTPSLPALPTIAESGVPGYAAETWLGLAVAARTPKDITARLHAATAKAMMLPEVRERLDALGYILRIGSAEEYSNFVQSEVDKWRKVVKTANVHVD
ncbi:MAG: tripartite tricarboxylate transporter substrate binding protein [Betaproteobacteria bacterium]